VTNSVPPGSSPTGPVETLNPATTAIAIIPPGPPIVASEHLLRQSYSLSTVFYFCGSVLVSSLSMLATIKNMTFFFPGQARQGYVPHPSSGRSWLLRLGYYRLNEPVQQADDWCYLLDHAIQVGKHRFLGVIGVRLSMLPPPGECLKLADLRVIALLPVEKSSQSIVHQQLETLTIQSGVIPAALLSDGGSDLTGGIARFCQAHPETRGFGDLPHHAAILLKRRVKDDERWCSFIKQATQTKFETAQTELVFLMPPTLRTKARYMNLQSMLGWALRVITVLSNPALIPKSYCSDERLKEKFDWLLEYRNEVELWSSWLGLTDATLDLIRRHGYCDATSQAIEPLLNPLCDSEQTQRLAAELIAQVQQECSKVREGERVPGSTEVLESSFGKLKSIEGSQAKTGFSGLILAWAALFGETTMATIKEAMQVVPGKLVKTWVKDNLDTTVHSKRTQLARNLRSQSTGNAEEP